MDKQITFKNAVLEGVFQVPYSKSVSNRMLIINALSGGKGSLENLSECDDTRVLRRALADGSALVDVGGAGTAMRFLAAYFALVPGEHVLTGSPRMARRPIKVLVDALRELGADIAYLGEEGYPPLRVTGGGLRGKNLVVDASVSSQYLSALMMIGPCVPGGLRLQLQGTPVSAPYLQMTAGLMRRCGARVRITRRAVLVQDGGYSRVPGVCEYDWSAVSFFYELLAVAGRGWMRFLGFRSASVQGDRAQVELWKRLGVRSVLSMKGLRINTVQGPLARVRVDLADMPDVALPFIVACCLREVPFRVSGLGTLRIKECDREEALVCELGKLGFPLRREDEGVLAWDGERVPPVSLVIDSHGDHRVAMAFAAAGLVFPGLVIRDAEVVDKSFPGFWEEIAPLLR